MPQVLDCRTEERYTGSAMFTFDVLEFGKHCRLRIVNLNRDESGAEDGSKDTDATKVKLFAITLRT